MLYKAVGASANFRVPVRDAYIQKVPRWRDRPFWGPYEDLIAFTEKVLQLTGGVTIEDIVRILEEALSVEIMTNEIEKVLYDMKQAGEVSEDKNKVWSLI